MHTYIDTCIHRYIHTILINHYRNNLQQKIKYSSSHQVLLSDLHNYIITYIHTYIHTYIYTILINHYVNYLQIKIKIIQVIKPYSPIFTHTYIHTYTRTYVHTHVRARCQLRSNWWSVSGFATVSSSKMILKAVERRFVALNYFANWSAWLGEWVWYMQIIETLLHIQT
jgi:hypothetical protein